MKLPKRTSLMCVLPGLLIACAVTPAWCQASGSAFVALPRAFAGIGVGVSSTDAESRMRFGGDVSPLVWLVEGGVSLSSRVGLGVEYVRVGDLTVSTNGFGWTSSGTEQEYQVIGLIRARVHGGTRVAVDVVGGAGVLSHHHELRFAPCNGGCADTDIEAIDRSAPAFAFGADVTIGGNRHFAVVTLARVYVLDRGDHTYNASQSGIPWQYDWTSCVRSTLAITARVGW